MNHNPLPVRVTFFPVKDNNTKLLLICNKIQETLKQEKRILITVPTEEAAHYIDSLLWRIPEWSFIPHSIIHTSTQEWVAITTVMTHNLNGANRLLNLCPQSCPIYQQFEEIYEFYDDSHPQKAEQSQKKFIHYQSQGIFVNR